MDRGHDEASAQKRQGSEFASKPLRGFTVSKAGLQRKKPGKKHFPSHPLLFTKPQSENTADHRNNAADYILTHTGLAADANMHTHALITSFAPFSLHPWYWLHGKTHADRGSDLFWHLTVKELQGLSPRSKIN